MKQEKPFKEFGLWFKHHREKYPNLTAQAVVNEFSKVRTELGLEPLNQRIIYLIEAGVLLPRSIYIKAMCNMFGMPEELVRKKIHEAQDKRDYELLIKEAEKKKDKNVC